MIFKNHILSTFEPYENILTTENDVATLTSGPGEADIGAGHSGVGPFSLKAGSADVPPELA